MRRWTILLISHDTEAPRSFSFTERTLRRAGSLGAALLLVGVIGVGTFVARLGNLPQGKGVTVSKAAAASPEVAALQARLKAIRGTIDTIRREDARLRSVAGVPGTDSETVLQRFVTRLPRFLRDKGPRPVPPPAQTPAAQGVATAAQLATTAAEADTLLAHATGLASGYRQLGPPAIGLDTLEVLSLRPESLHVAASAGNPRVSRAGRVVRWAPTRRGAMLAGFDAEVAHAVERESGRWQIDLRAPGGLVGRVYAAGVPAVRKGERVRADQAVILVAPGVSLGGASYELRRNGISLDPTFSRSQISNGSVR